eukprot:TRINITY_DN11801_c0_g2_i1.p1 TRINITY_DN11801_c0_g2~~TRINITY_DN11801_c0_g2_i1.p1  ORF type:complete len:615 (+),score=85.79 TRINITY_DN11801_c0_g2_i1:151-1995(+)
MNSASPAGPQTSVPVAVPVAILEHRGNSTVPVAVPVAGSQDHGQSNVPVAVPVGLSPDLEAQAGVTPQTPLVESLEVQINRENEEQEALNTAMTILCLPCVVYELIEEFLAYVICFMMLIVFCVLALPFLPCLCCVLCAWRIKHEMEGRSVRLDGTIEQPEEASAAAALAEAQAARERLPWKVRLDAIVQPRLRQLGNSFGGALSASRRGSFGGVQGGEGGSFNSVASLSTRSRNAELKRKELLAKRREALEHNNMPGHLYITVSRERLVEQTLRCLASVPSTELVAKNLHVQFDKEEGMDLGGLARDWIDCVASGLAEAAETDCGHLMVLPDKTLAPRPHDQRLGDLLAIGRLAGLALWFGIPLPLALSHIACKLLLDLPLNVEDIRRLDPEFYQYRLEPILRPDGVATMEAALGEPLTFVSAATELRPSKELFPGGATTVVTEENKAEYLQLLCEYYLCGETEQQIKMVLQGFWEILPQEDLLAVGLTPRELALLIAGYPCLDVSDWQAHTKIIVDDADVEVVTWFWEILEEMDAVDRAKVLHFSTGSSRLPATGFAAVTPQFDLCIRGDPEQLPHAHTCGNQLVLPKYTSRQQLLEKLRIALDNDAGFGFL